MAVLENHLLSRNCAVLLIACLQTISNTPATAEQPVQPARTVQILKTADGVRFGLLGSKPSRPAPTLIVLANTAEETLGSEYYLQCGVELSRRGYCCVSIDLPCHGSARKPNEPAELAGWCHRVDAGEDLLGEFREQMRSVLDHLVAEQYSDPNRIAACGTSRGAFAALHLSACDRRVRAVVAMCPVTDLLVLSEFSALKNPDRARALSLSSTAEKLVDREILIVTGDNDLRVGTDQTIAFARRLSALAAERKVTSPVALHLMPAPGHTTPAGSVKRASEWLMERLEQRKN